MRAALVAVGIAVALVGRPAAATAQCSYNKTWLKQADGSSPFDWCPKDENAPNAGLCPEPILRRGLNVYSCATDEDLGPSGCCTGVLCPFLSVAIAACGFGDDRGHGGDDGGATCGDGAVDPGEDCDDDGVAAGDGCSASCGVEVGWTCTGQPSVCTMTQGSCGDGAMSSGEACDDGAVASGDGCSAECQVEAGWECAGAPSTCTRTCGNGATNAGEGCDDGGVVGGDGCSVGCAIEAGWQCTGTPSICTQIPTACSLVPQGGCAPGAACDLTAAENGDTTCRPITANGTSDSFCVVDTACAAGYTCVGTVNATCMRFCASDAGCGGSARCVNTLVNGAGIAIPGGRVCTNSCAPLAQTGCPSGLGCVAYNATAGDFTDCEVMGTKLDGATCASGNECQPGSTCAAVGVAPAICRSYCRVGGPNTCGVGNVCLGFVNPLLIGADEIGACD